MTIPNIIIDFRSNSDGVFEENGVGVEEWYVYMTRTSFYLPPEGQYKTVIILICPGVSAIGDKPSIYQNFFDNPISNAHMFYPAILESSKRINNGAKSDETSDDGTTVQPLLNTWMSDEVSNSINNNNNNFNNNNNDNNILTSNVYSERRHNNIGIDNNTIIIT